MANKPANTPKSAKPAGKAVKSAAAASTKGGQKITRPATASRSEVRRQNPQQQGSLQQGAQQPRRTLRRRGSPEQAAP